MAFPDRNPEPHEILRAITRVDAQVPGADQFALYHKLRTLQQAYLALPTPRDAAVRDALDALFTRVLDEVFGIRPTLWIREMT